MKLSPNFLCGGAMIALGLSACSQANQEAKKLPTSTPAVRAQVEKTASGHPDKLLWGDTHLHTLNSADAFSFGARLSPSDAYRFARGDEVTSNTGLVAKLKRPLDFLVVADHAEGLGLINELYVGNPKLISDPKAKRWHEMLNEGVEQSTEVGKELIVSHANNELPKTMRNPLTILPLMRSIWKRNTLVAEEFNDPGTFTTLIGYEYTSTPGGDNLHRNVIFRDSKDRADKVLPFSSTRSDNPEDLWKWMARYEKKTGGQVLAIPHNSNLSNGLMFAKTDFKGKEIDAKYAKTRARWEPVVEVTQIKGDSEAHPFLSPNDEFSGFGDVGWDLGNLSLQAAKTQEMLKGDYVREALKTGLALKEKTGTNPFKLGMIGATDSHTGLSTGDEDNFFGKFGVNEPHKERATETIGLGGSKANRYGWQYLAGGYAGVWARDNTRAEIWDALKRKEVYGTTGPRMKVRFFGGDYSAFNDPDIQDVVITNIAEFGYKTGVPMGGDISLAKGTSPSFIIAASKDPDGANLERAQIIKGWMTADGKSHEKVYDVVLANDKANGQAELMTIWSDPSFDSSQPAFYYVRVLEIPTSRWVNFDAERFGADIPKDAVRMARERAYTSPIWYTPQ